MNMKLTKGLLGLGALLIAGQASAGTISIDPSVSNIALNQPFTLTVQGSDFLDGLAVAPIEVTWDNSQMQLTTTTQDVTVELLFTTGFDGTFVPVSLVTDAITNMSTLSVTAATPLPTFPGENTGLGIGGGVFNIFSLDFIALPPPGQEFLNVGIVPGVGNFIDGLGNADTNMTFVDATVNIGAVPVPAAVWLFGSGLIGLVGVARRKTQLA